MPDAHEREFLIHVNGRPRKTPATTLSYDDLVKLAYDNKPPTGPNVVITVTYTHGEHNASGLLIAGQSVAVKSGMSFNVTSTDKS